MIVYNRTDLCMTAEDAVMYVIVTTPIGVQSVTAADGYRKAATTGQ